MRRPVELLILDNVRVVDPGSGLDERADVAIEGGRITRIGPGAAASFEPSADQALRVAGEGRWLVPGFVELGAHLGEPGYEYREDLASGLAAAAAGGFVAVCCQPDSLPVNDSHLVCEWLVERAARLSPVRLLPIAAATRDLKGAALTQMGELKRAGACAVGDAKRPVQSSAVMRRVLEYARGTGLPVFQLPVDLSLEPNAAMHEGVWSTRLGLRGSPSAAERIQLARDLALCELTGARYHASAVSTAEACALARRAKQAGVPATAAAPMSHLLLSDAELRHYDTNLKLEPPLRGQQDSEALCAALTEGVLDAVTSDHQPRSDLEKNCEFAAAEPGSVGLEHTLGVLLRCVREGRLSTHVALSALTTGPARVLGLDAPRVRVGQVADLVLLSPEAEWSPAPNTLRSKSRNAAWMDRPLVGQVDLTLAGGQIAYQRPGLVSTGR